MNQPGNITPPLLTYAQVGALTGKSVSTIEKWVRQRQIPFHRIGRSVRFDPLELRQWLEENDLTADNRVLPARPLKKRPGAQYVFPADTLGDEHHCWCGDQIGHDWPGKSTGAPHPHEHERTPQVVVVEQVEPSNNRIEKTDLRGYHAALKSFVIRCVNIDGLNYRIGKNSLLLFPPDGTQPVTVYCRNNDSQIRSLNQWYAAHVTPAPDEVDDTAVARLAETVNDPVEHPRDDEQEPAEWTPYTDTQGATSEFYETDGVIIRCRVCVGTETAYETPVERITGLGGHIRMNHTDTTTLRDADARAKALDSRRYNRLHEQVTVAVELLAETIGYIPDNSKVQDLEREVERLKRALDKEKKRADDAEGRLRQFREAFRGLE